MLSNAQVSTCQQVPKWKRWSGGSQTIPRILGSAFPLIAFPNSCLDWKEAQSTRKQSPIQIEDESELVDLVLNRIHFRDPQRYEDNYHITTPALDWFVVFCHHDDWHFFASNQAVTKVREQWKRKSQQLDRTRLR